MVNYLIQLLLFFFISTFLIHANSLTHEGYRQIIVRKIPKTPIPANDDEAYKMVENAIALMEKLSQDDPVFDLKKERGWDRFFYDCMQNKRDLFIASYLIPLEAYLLDKPIKEATEIYHSEKTEYLKYMDVLYPNQGHSDGYISKLNVYVNARFWKRVAVIGQKYSYHKRNFFPDKKSKILADKLLKSLIKNLPGYDY